MRKSYCRSCVYYKGPEGHGTYGKCANPENIRLKDTWLEEREECVREPDALNRHNDCHWYKPLGF